MLRPRAVLGVLAAGLACAPYERPEQPRARPAGPDLGVPGPRQAPAAVDLPVLAAKTRLAPTRPLANFTVLARQTGLDTALWPLGDRYQQLDDAAAARLDLRDPLRRDELPEPLRMFIPRRQLGDAILMVRSNYDEHNYVALAANTIRWQYDIASRVHQDLIAPRALVVHLYAPEADTLVGIALGSGRELWRHTGAAADAPFTRIRKLGHDGERGYLLGDRGLSAFDTATGAILWSNVAIAEGCGFAAAGDRLVVEDPSGGHRVLDPRTAAVQRTLSGPGRQCVWDIGAWGGGVAPAVIDGDQLVAFDPPDARGLATLRAFDLQTGAERWHRPALAPGLLLLDHDAVYVHRVPAVLTALDAANGQTRAEVTVGDEHLAWLEPAGDAAGPLIIVASDLSGVAVLGRAEAPSTAERYTIRGRLVPVGIPRGRIKNVVVQVGEQRVKTDASGRFKASGAALGAIGVTLATPKNQANASLQIEPQAVTLDNTGPYDLGDIEAHDWMLY